ncbi:hypothetical protein PVK06_038459 [Gossypium arboreum]|uniref:Uncharacterized protein n=1 Tax=Gossypium arboreum TaxID=29729 RepID=A0ABR0N286_GOSAR|nr:hypothetical protein PVK06_038459 [Gossypium arboreum]
MCGEYQRIVKEKATAAPLPAGHLRVFQRTWTSAFFFKLLISSGKPGQHAESRGQQSGYSDAYKDSLHVKMADEGVPGATQLMKRPYRFGVVILSGAQLRSSNRHVLIIIVDLNRMILNVMDLNIVVYCFLRESSGI